MVFFSLEFLFLYFPASIAIYYITPAKFRNISLFLASLVFFGWGGVLCAVFLPVSITANYIFGLLISRQKGKHNIKREKLFFYAAVFMNLFFLAFLKYFGFPVLVLLFYTLHIMSYIFDLYAGKSKAQKNIASLGVYSAAFFKITAGPVCKYHEMEKELTQRKESFSMFSRGILVFICGLCKKLFFADTAFSVFSYIKALPEGDITVLGSWLGLVFFFIYIYFGVSGYFDMASGLGKIFGFDLPKSFDYPCMAKSVTEFCRRFHTTLFDWFKDYLYIPFCKNKRFAKALKFIPGFIGRIFTLVFVFFGCLILAFEDIQKGFVYFGRLFGFSVKRIIDTGAVYDVLRYLPFLVLAVLGCTPFFKKLKTLGKSDKPKRVLKIAVPVISAVLLLFCTAFLVDSPGSGKINKYIAEKFPARGFFVGSKTLFSYAFMINENRETLIAKEGYLIPRFDRYSEKSISEKSSGELGGNLTFAENMANIQNNCGYINEFFGNIKDLYPGIKTIFACPPRKIDAMTNKLPAFFPSERHEKYFWELEQYINPDIYCNLLDIMRSKNGEYIYYKTDHHWTTLGAYYAYAALGEKMGYTPLPKEEFAIETASENFYGVMWARAGARWIKPDTIEYYKLGSEDSEYKTFIHTATEPIVLPGFYDREKLGTGDKYASFLGGITSHISVRSVTPVSERKKLLLVSDSFGQSLAPFLARHYDIEIIDTRFFNKKIYDFVLEYNITDILILSNMENFSTQNNLVKLMRR